MRPRARSCDAPRATTCAWCKTALPDDVTEQTLYCSKKCRQSAFRLRRRRATTLEQSQPIRVCFSDPPYPGLAKRCYGNEPTYAGEVDHAALIAELERDFPDGWALATGAYALREVLPLCPEGVRVCAWTKPIGASPQSNGIHNCWEPVIVCRGRQRRPGVRDHLSAQPARFGGDLVGVKPIAYCAWLFDLLGLQPGDELVDKYPGSGAVSRAWDSLQGEAARRSPRAPDDEAPRYLDASGKMRTVQEREHDEQPDAEADEADQPLLGLARKGEAEDETEDGDEERNDLDVHAPMMAGSEP